MTDAARLALTVRDGLAAVAEWEAEHGLDDVSRIADAAGARLVIIKA